MSGHSKWAQIKRQKAVTDAKRGKLFTKLANAIIVAVKTGGGPNPDSNPRLKMAVEQARAGSMPAENIKRAIERASGAGAAATEEVIYEGYGPEGVAIVVSGVTDNKNRTASEVRAAFTKNNGKMGEVGSVAWTFVDRGLISIKKIEDKDAQMLDIIDAGTEDVDEAGEAILAYTAPDQLAKVRGAVAEKGYEVIESRLTKTAKNLTSIEDPAKAKQVLSLIDALEELDDVTETYANYDIPDTVMNEVLASA